MHKGMRIRDQLKKKTKRRDIIIIALLEAAHSRVHIHGSFHVSHGKSARGSKQLVGSLGRTGAAQPATLFHRVNYRSSSSRRTSPLCKLVENIAQRYSAKMLASLLGETKVEPREIISLFKLIYTPASLRSCKSSRATDKCNGFTRIHSACYEAICIFQRRS